MGFSHTSIMLCILRTLCAFLISSAIVTHAHANHWRVLSPGISYRDLDDHPLTPWSHTHVFRINLKHNQLDLVMANELAQPHASINEFAHFSHALIGINGGFFDEKYNPLGLRVSNKAEHNPLKRISWWGIFYITNNVPHVSSLINYDVHKPIDFAVQSGPRLIIDGQIPTLKPGRAERTALGITPDGLVIILVTENTPITTTELANIMRSAPLHCIDALNLDGGSSSQLSAKIGSFRVNVHGFANVADAIIVKAKNSD
jgi:uncharacterized protein YigE (DUF2233 family)